MKRSLFLAAAILCSASRAFSQAAAPALPRIGAAAAVKGAVKAQAPGSVGRVVESGKPLFLNDHVTTDAAGRLQVMLLDETIFTIGPDSDMVLDEFVYDPAKSTGKVAARVTKGVFRFVTGKVAQKNPDNMQVKLPVGTIGIRGTMAAGEVRGENVTALLLGPGAHGNTDESRGAITFDGKTIDQPGYGVQCRGGTCSAVRDLKDVANRLTQALAVTPDPAKAKGGSGESATKQSGQQAAAGKNDAIQALADAASGEETSEVTQNAFNDKVKNGIPDGVATWDQLRALPLGSATYLSSITALTCTGGLCGGGTAANVQFQLDVNFAARTYGGGSSDVNVTSTLIGSTNINSTSFSSLAGNATFTLNNGSGNSTNPQFDGTAFTFKNVAGEVAKSVEMKINYSASGASIQNQSISTSR
jgi:hypothetical protein